MRESIREFVSVAAAAMPTPGPVVEFGSLQVPGQEGFADLRPFFAGREYIGADMREGPGVDRVLDLHDIDLPDGFAGTVICVDTLEHVEDPRRALEEIHRVLKPDGLVILSSVMAFAIHDYPHDYWRFTPDGFRALLKPFAESFAGFAGRPDFPHTVVGIGFKGKAPDLAEFDKRYAEWQAKYFLEVPAKAPEPAAVSVPPPPPEPLQEPGRNLRHALKLVTPPIIHPLFSKLYRATFGRKKPSR